MPGFGGGYVGVDVFYVISGFLITGLLWRELATSGRISLLAFYARRARRLLPAAMLVLVVTVAAAAVWLPPLSAQDVTKDAMAAAFYVANYRFAVHGTDYLAVNATPSPLLHYWSLAVEEQFYLIWPLVLLLVTVGASARKARAAFAIGTLALGSFALSLSWAGSSPTWAFYSLPTRAWELAAGGLLALAAPALSRLPVVLATVFGWLGVGTIISGYAGIGSHTPLAGTAAAVLGAAMVIAAGCSAVPAGPGVLLRIQPLQAIGRTSYSWYLWHWPILVLAQAAVGTSLGLGGRLIAVSISAFAAKLTLVLVEDPLRFARPLRSRPKRSLGLAATFSVTALVASFAAARTLPNLQSSGPAARPIALAPTAVGPGPHQVQNTPHSPLEQSAAAAVAQGVGTRTVPSNLAPSLDDADIDKAEPFFDGCALTWTATDQGECAYADTAAPTRIVLFGDSHAAQWQPTFEAIANARHWRVESLNKTTCPPLKLPIFSPYLSREYTECEQWRERMLARIRAEHPALVVLGVARHYNDDYHFTVYSRQWLDGMTAMVDEIHKMGVPVLVMGAIPKPPADVPTCLSAQLHNVPACTFTRQATVNETGLHAEATATTAGNGTYLNLIPLMCAEKQCPVIVGNNLVYRDDNHVTTSYAKWLAPVVADQLARLGLR